MEFPGIEMIMFLVAAGFIAAFIDSVVGGGGLISLPALMFAGLPPSLAIGTNKLAGTMSSLTSMVSFFLSGKINFKLVRWLFPLAFGGSALGSYTVTLIPNQFLIPMVIVLLIAVTVYTLFKKKWGEVSSYTTLNTKTAVLVALGSFALGFYDGFFGPGTGSFLIFMFLFVGLDFVGASANAKVLNFASNISSLITFALLHSVNISYGLPMGLAMIFGAIIGSQVAVRKGTGYVKPLFVLVTTLSVINMVYRNYF